jgi:hypothetical protein
MSCTGNLRNQATVLGNGNVVAFQASSPIKGMDTDDSVRDTLTGCI